MAKKIDLSVIDNLESKFDSQEEWQTAVNLTELVGRLFFSIDTAVKRKASWAKIAEFIQESIGSDEKINPNTLRQYYFHFKSHPEELPKKKRNSSNSKKKQKVDTGKVPASTMTTEAPARSDGCSTSTAQETIQSVDSQAANTGENITPTELPLPEPRKKSGSSFAY